MLRFFSLVCAVCSVLLLQGDKSQGQEVGSNFATWDAEAPDRGSLGLKLSDSLVVLGFVADKHGFAPALHTRGGVLIGDSVAAVNGQVTNGSNLGGAPRGVRCN